MRSKWLFTVITSMLISSCSKQMETANIPIPVVTNPKTYLALGDSYTIGESVPQHGSFPYQLKEMLGAEYLPVANPLVIARTGWTTGELDAAITDAKPASTYDFVTLLIGVNNQYRGYSKDEYRVQFRALLNRAIGFAKGNKKHVFVVSIPDWGVTPFGKASGRGAAAIAAEIDEFNRINREETQLMEISYTDITPGSRQAATDASLVAIDGLHPSEKMYKTWAAALAPKIAAILK